MFVKDQARTSPNVDTIEPGVDYVGPLPGELQRMTMFSTGIHAGAKQAEAAKALVKFLTAPTAAPVIRKHGLEPTTQAPSFDAYLDMIHPDDREPFRTGIGAALEGVAPFALDFRVVWPDGSVRHVHAIGRPVVNESGDLVEMFGTIIDITERKRAEAELRASESRHRHIFQAVGVSMPFPGAWDLEVVARFGELTVVSFRTTLEVE